MASSSLEHRTIRPGKLGTYSYYRSARRPDTPPRSTPFITGSWSKLIPRKLVVALVLVAAIAVPVWRGGHAPAKSISDQARSGSSQTANRPSQSPAAAVVTAPSTASDKCAGQGTGKLVLVSISQRHMWACSGAKTAYDSPVITGMSAYASTVTPPGTYRIYSKQTHLTLTGSDVTGSWNDPVNYWMPFLANRYGTYGFHD
ncbi:MAG: L,D-transpeptidase, partial [Candidatus Saccharimonadales bacterium]